MMARFRGMAAGIFAGICLTLVSFAAIAAETASEVDVTEYGGAEHSGGMPQLDVSTYSSQVVWLIIFFVLLYQVVSKLALPQLTEVIRQREERISGDLDKAAELRAEAEAAYSRYEADVADAHARAQLRIKELRERIAEEQAARLAELDASMAEKIAAAEQRIGKARETAMAEVEGAAVETAQAAVERLIGSKVGRDEVERALQAVVKREAA